MDCPNPDCQSAPVPFTVPESLREFAPETASAAAICPRCLTVAAIGADTVPDDAASHLRVDAVSDAVPTGDAAIPFVLLLWNLESLARNRAAIESLLDRIERGGGDPLLALDRLIADDGVDPAIDLDRRRTQVESLLY